MLTKLKIVCLILLAFLHSVRVSAEEDTTNRYMAEQAADRAEAAIMEANRIAELERERICLKGERRYIEDPRLRPRTEAQKRQYEEEERRYKELDCFKVLESRDARLKLLCPIYSTAREICGGFSNYESCMKNTSGNPYSRQDDLDCQRILQIRTIRLPLH